MVISMKMINCNDWVPHSNNDWTPRNKLNIPIPITNPPILPNGDNLYYLWFYRYYRLSKFSSLIHLFYHKLEHLYSILDEDDYFDEDD